MRIRLILAAVFALSASAAVADDEPLATNRDGPPPPKAESPAPLPVDTGWTDDQPAIEDFRPDRRPHGAVSLGIGTGGYREAAAAVVAPVGENGTVAASFVYVERNTPVRVRRDGAGAP